MQELAANQELAEALQAYGPRVAGRPIDDMYRDAFWQERFGSRGRKHSYEDAVSHVSYLVEALRAQSPEVLAKYARWLRTVLVSHGMCSHDLQENLDRLAVAISTDFGEEAAAAVEYLGAARDALMYQDGAAAELERARAQLGRDALTALSLESQAHLPTARSLHVDPLHLLMYLTDALAAERPELLRAHLRWAGPALSRHNVPENFLPELTRAVRGVLSNVRDAWSSVAERVWLAALPEDISHSAR